MSVFRDLLMDIKSGRLPSQYQEVEYIESSGTQRIDTGIKPNDNNYGFKSKFQITFNSGNWNLMNMGGSNVDVNRFGFGGYKSGSSIYYQIGNIRGMVGSSGWTNIRNTILYINTDYEIEYNYNGNRKFVSNGSVLLSNIPTGTNVVEYSNNWNIFCQAYSSNSFDRFLIGKLYYMKIYLGETILRDYIPCYRKSDGVIGLYDLVSKSFYINQGSGTFTKGIDVN